MLIVMMTETNKVNYERYLTSQGDRTHTFSIKWSFSDKSKLQKQVSKLLVLIATYKIEK